MLSKRSQAQMNMYILSLFIWNSRKWKLNFNEIKDLGGFLGSEMSKQTAKGHNKYFGVMEMFYILIVFIGVYTFVKINWTLHLKQIHFIICKLHINKMFKLQFF